MTTHIHRRMLRLRWTGYMLVFAIVGLLGAMTIRETNCRYITITQK
jgi:hypothetical protein